MLDRDIENRIRSGLDLLFLNDGYLLANSVNERSITHKLAEHYQYLFPGWNVDCEFDRNLADPKKIEIDPKLFLSQIADFIEEHSGQELDFLKREEFGVEEIGSVLEQLRDKENILYNDELDLVYFVLKLRNGKKVVKKIYPDIIVHHRGTRNNHIVVEAKKSSNKAPRSRLYDMAKLMTLVSHPDYQYDWGLFIDLPVAKDLEKFTGFRVMTTASSKVFKIIP